MTRVVTFGCVIVFGIALFGGVDIDGDNFPSWEVLVLAPIVFVASLIVHGWLLRGSARYHDRHPRRMRRESRMVTAARRAAIARSQRNR